MKTRSTKVLTSIVVILASSVISSPASAVPIGYQKTQTMTLNSPAAALAYAPLGSTYAGKLFVFEAAGFGSNSSVIRVINPDGTFDAGLDNIPVLGNDASNLFVGGMTYDTQTDRLLLTDNTDFSSGKIYSLDPAGSAQTTINTTISAIAGIAVRSTSEILVSTSDGAGAGQVLEVDRGTGSTVTAFSGLDFGAGVAFDASGDLIVQEANGTFPALTGILRRIPINDSGSSLVYSTAVPLISGMASSFGLAIDSEGDFFSTGTGGLFEVSGGPLTEQAFEASGFSAAISYFPGTNPFEPGETDGGRLALLAEANFGVEDFFVTIITPSFSSNASVPEPASLVLVLLGMIALVRVGRQRR